MDGDAAVSIVPSTIRCSRLERYGGVSFVDLHVVATADVGQDNLDGAEESTSEAGGSFLPLGRTDARCRSAAEKREPDHEQGDRH